MADTVLEKNLENRRKMVEAVRAELIGPDPAGPRLERPLPPTMDWETWVKFFPRTQSDGEELLKETPTRRYAAGILHPPFGREDALAAKQGLSPEGVGPAGLEEFEQDDGPRPELSTGAERQSRKTAKFLESVRARRFSEDEGSAADDVSSESGETDFLTASTRPSAFGLSVVVDSEHIGSGITVELISIHRLGNRNGDLVEAPCGFYKAKKIKVQKNGKSEEPDETGDKKTDTEWVIWARRPLLLSDKTFPAVHLTASDIEESGSKELALGEEFPSKLELRWHRRAWPEAPAGQKILTFTLINRGSSSSDSEVAQSLFQSGMRLTLPVEAVKPYPGALLRGHRLSDPSDDSIIAELLYHRRKTFAVGHGCSSDWSEPTEGNRQIWASFLPAWEIPPISFDAEDASRKKIDLPMRLFAGLDENAREGEDFQRLESLVSAYENWVEQLESEPIPTDFEPTSKILIERAQECARRMRRGVNLLKQDDPECSLQAFRLANQAMLMSQHRRPADSPRRPEWRGKNCSFDGEGKYTHLDLPAPETIKHEEEKKIGRWRPFQLASILMSIPDIVQDDELEDAEEDESHRDTVDLIWFPTGGGKTEAYLGLSAFTVLFNRLSGREFYDLEEEKPTAVKNGQRRAVTIIMRYTLRLLTAQQFQRAVTLFCALELIRANSEELGSWPFNVGLWVGGSVSENKSSEAVRKLKVLNGTVQPKGDEDRDANPFVLLQCPWCSAEFGRVHQFKEKGNQRYVVHGYVQTGVRNNAEVSFRCPDPHCEFGQGSQIIQSIPALVVDEQIYNHPPSLLISTVDKFAQLAWKPETRALLGIGEDGRRAARSPELIIQDELHLITGPLGTMVGHFESAIDFLCRHDDGTSPKIIASTATAAYAGEQVKGLYARECLRVFPPAGLDAADSFFAREIKDAPGRLYVGAIAPDHPSMQTTQRHVYAALLQEAATIALDSDPDQAALMADPWWTILAFYNSIRELGGALTLFGADVREQLKVLQHRRALSPLHVRQVQPDHSVMELTSRIRSDEVPEALRMLNTPLRGFSTRDRSDERTCWSERLDQDRNWSPIQDACLASNMIEVGVDVGRLALMVIVGQPKTTSSYIQASSRVGRQSDRPGLVLTLYSNSKPRDRSHFDGFRAYHEAIYKSVEPTSVTPFSIPVIDRALKAVLVAISRQSLPGDKSPGAVANILSEAVGRDEEPDVSWSDIKKFLEERARLIEPEDTVIHSYLAESIESLIRNWKALEPTRWGSASGLYQQGASRPFIYPSGAQVPSDWSAVWRIPLSLRDVDSTSEAGITSHYSSLSRGEE